jgi:hypothetical protein
MPASSESEEPTVIRKTVQTGVKGQPQLEMFLRLPPPSVLKNRPLRGTIAFCNWDGDPEVLQNRLLYRPGMKTTNAVFSDVANRIIRYAEHNDLAVLTWSVALVWNLSGNTGDLKRKDAADFERNFNKLASSWEEGVKFLHRKHGMPEKDMLLYGFSRGAQWAHRLALRKPDYFLAVHAQIASTYDTPTPQGQKVLWLITTGELEGGYENSKRFYKECRNLGYPIIYKAIEGIGHIDSFQAQLLGYRFFNYALTLREKRSESFKKDGGSLALNARSQPAEWLSGYRNPPYVGDLLNQEVFAASESEIISDSLRVPLPTKEIANTWGNAEPLRAEAWDE